MTHLVESESYKGYEINIYYDEMPESPREWDNLGTMVCFHGRYNLGDEHDYNSDDYSSWDEIENAICKDNDIAVILPLYLYDHSGITMNTTGFSCGWDSGQVGFIFITKEKVRSEYSVKRISKKLKVRIESYLVNEVETYDNFISGQVYGYQIEDKFGNDIEDGSCWGFFGYDHEKSGLLGEAKSTIDYYVEKDKPKEIQLSLPGMAEFNERQAANMQQIQM